MRSNLIAASTGLALVALVVWRSTDSGTTSARAHDELTSADDVAQLRRQSQHLEAEVRRLRALVEAGPKQAPSASPAATSAAPQGAPVPPATPSPSIALAAPEASDATEARYRGQLDRLLVAEAPDPAWSEASDLSRRVQDALPDGSSLEDLRCGSSLCRVMVSHPNLDAYNAFSGDAFHAPDTDRLWTGPGIFMVLDDDVTRKAGRLLTIMYLGRGETLPALAAEK